jgi:hypothetical protein
MARRKVIAEDADITQIPCVSSHVTGYFRRDDEEAIHSRSTAILHCSLKLSRTIRPTSEHAMILAKHSTLFFHPLEPIGTELARWCRFGGILGTLLVDLACGMQHSKITTGAARRGRAIFGVGLEMSGHGDISDRFLLFEYQEC